MLDSNDDIARAAEARRKLEAEMARRASRPNGTGIDPDEMDADMHAAYAEAQRKRQEQEAHDEAEHEEFRRRAEEARERERAKERSRYRFPLIPFRDLKPSPAADYIVKGLLPRIGLAVIWGPPKCGKSFWFLDLLLHVALGWTYRGKRVQQGAVVYCAFEGAEGFKKRAEAFRRHHDLSTDHDVPLYVMPMRMNLVQDHVALINEIRAQLGPVVPVAVALDTLNRSLAGSESSDEDMSGYVNAGDAIREAFGCLVGIVHHCGIDGTRPRGHTSLSGAIEVQLAVQKDGGTFTVTAELLKDGPEGEVLTCRLEVVDVGTDDDGDPIRSCVVVEAVAGAAGPKGSSKPSKPLRSFAKALDVALLDHGQEIYPYGVEGPRVRAVPVEKVREEFIKAYPADSGTPEARADTKSKAFRRVLVEATTAELVTAREIGGTDYLWKTRE